MAKTLPLQNLDNDQVELTNQGVNYPEEVNTNHIKLSESQQNMLNKIKEAVNNGFDLDEQTEFDEESENETHPIKCKYYTTEQLNNEKLSSVKHFSILHINIHSLEFHIDELRIALQLIRLKFDFICISESKLLKNYDSHTDISIEGYQQPVGTPTEASKGGVLIYPKQDIDFKPRDDLIIYKPKELESYFLETISKKGKNSLIGIIYRHPCMNQNLFIDEFMQPLNEMTNSLTKTRTFT